MKATQLIEFLARRIATHGNHEVYAGILLCDPADERARVHRFPVDNVDFCEDASDSLDAHRGPAFELRIFQNESLRSH